MEFAIHTEFITLGQLAKATGLIGSGSDIKAILGEEPALVNGEEESRRGRKLYPGDVVVLPGSTEQVKITRRPL